MAIFQIWLLGALVNLLWFCAIERREGNPIGRWDIGLLGTVLAISALWIVTIPVQVIWEYQEFLTKERHWKGK